MGEDQDHEEHKDFEEALGDASRRSTERGPLPGEQ